MNHNKHAHGNGAIVKTLGGDRLGAGNKMKVALHNYERSTHDLSYLWRSSMSAGTLVPFLSQVALPGDTWDINLNANVMTHPTLGPLFGSYKVQLDVFTAPIRLYQGELHNNKLGIGLYMQNVYLPIIKMYAKPFDNTITPDIDNQQISPSCIHSYLGIRGVGNPDIAEGTALKERDFNAIPLLAYWDIYKNYYSNKQEQRGFYLYTTPFSPMTTGISSITWGGGTLDGTQILTGISGSPLIVTSSVTVDSRSVVLITDRGIYTIDQLFNFVNVTGTTYTYALKPSWASIGISNWRYATASEYPPLLPVMTEFGLGYIDTMREQILAWTTSGTSPFVVNDHLIPGDPFDAVLTWSGTNSPYLGSQQGLGLKTYQSDLLNNWLFTDWIDGGEGINAITAISTVSGSFTIDTLQLSKKVYDMLNRIAVSGGSYNDWMEAVWSTEGIQRAETPIYHGGLIKELIFQEVISNAQAGLVGPVQPLGTLAGRGALAQKHKGGQIRISIDEPCYVMGIVSLTPRIDYSQGNTWDVHLQTMDDFHKPALDQIGFQELITEQMAWFDTTYDFVGNKWVQHSAGKQPAWVNYMTNVNRVLGNFAIPNNEMFMTLNRRYGVSGGRIADVTTYIDPAKFNFIFAQTSEDSQNFWTQIAVDMEVRRKMSAKVMPNL